MPCYLKKEARLVKQLLQTCSVESIHTNQRAACIQQLWKRIISDSQKQPKIVLFPNVLHNRTWTVFESRRRLWW